MDCLTNVEGISGERIKPDVEIHICFGAQQHNNHDNNNDNNVHIFDDSTQLYIPNKQKRFQLDKWYRFDQIYPFTGNNSQVYEKSVFELVEETLKGFNTSMFLYGQSRKNEILMAKDGVLAHLASHLFDRLSKKVSTSKEDLTSKEVSTPKEVSPSKEVSSSDELSTSTLNVYVSYVQIINEEIFDLLDPSIHQLLVNTKKPGSIASRDENVTWMLVQSPTDLYGCIESGFKLAETSSRNTENSHFVCQLCIEEIAQNEDETKQDNKVKIQTEYDLEEQKNTKGKQEVLDQNKIKGKISIIDLAFSERIEEKISQSTKEVQSTNLSLLELGNVISAISKGSDKKHIPYRNSVLTNMLVDSLEKLVVLISCSTETKNMGKTRASLEFGGKMKKDLSKLINKPIICYSKLYKGLELKKETVESGQQFFLKEQHGVLDMLQKEKEKQFSDIVLNAEEILQKENTILKIQNRSADYQCEMEDILVNISIKEGMIKSLNEKIDTLLSKQEQMRSFIENVNMNDELKRSTGTKKETESVSTNLNEYQDHHETNLSEGDINNGIPIVIEDQYTIEKKSEKKLNSEILDFKIEPIIDLSNSMEKQEPNETNISEKQLNCEIPDLKMEPILDLSNSIEDKDQYVTNVSKDIIDNNLSDLKIDTNATLNSVLISLSVLQDPLGSHITDGEITNDLKIEEASTLQAGFSNPIKHQNPHDTHKAEQKLNNKTPDLKIEPTTNPQEKHPHRKTKERTTQPSRGDEKKDSNLHDDAEDAFRSEYVHLKKKNSFSINVFKELSFPRDLENNTKDETTCRKELNILKSYLIINLISIREMYKTQNTDQNDNVDHQNERCDIFLLILKTFDQISQILSIMIAELSTDKLKEEVKTLYDMLVKYEVLLSNQEKLVEEELIELSSIHAPSFNPRERESIFDTMKTFYMSIDHYHLRSNDWRKLLNLLLLSHDLKVGLFSLLKARKQYFPKSFINDDSSDKLTYRYDKRRQTSVKKDGALSSSGPNISYTVVCESNSKDL